MRVDGEAAATAGAEAVAAANAGEAASWRASAEEGKRVVEETARLFEAWALDLERDRAGFGDAVGLSTGKKRTSKKTATGSRRKGASRHERDTPAPPFGASRHERDALHERDTLHERDVPAPPLRVASAMDRAMERAMGDGSRDDDVRTPKTPIVNESDARQTDTPDASRASVRAAVARLPPAARIAHRALHEYLRVSASTRACREAAAAEAEAAAEAHRGASRACRETRARVEAEMEAARTAVREEVEAEEAEEAEAAEAEEAEEAEAAEEAKEAAEAATKVQRENRGRLASRASDAVTASRRSTPKKSSQKSPKKSPRGSGATPRTPPSSGKNPYGAAKRLLREGQDQPASASPAKTPPWKPPSYTIYDSPSSHPPPDL